MGRPRKIVDMQSAHNTKEAGRAVCDDRKKPVEDSAEVAGR